MTDIPEKIKADVDELLHSIGQLGSSFEIDAAKANVKGALEFVRLHLAANGQAQPMPTEEDQKPKGGPG